MHLLTLALLCVLAALLLASPSQAQDVFECPKSEAAVPETQDQNACPCVKGWEPTDDQLETILARHEEWLTDLENLFPFVVRYEGKGLAEQVPEGERRASLCNASLEKADLNGVNLYLADLNGAGLKDAQLNRARLGEATLNGANLEWAELNGAGLKDAQLNGAGLGWAKLNCLNPDTPERRCASLVRAELNGANLIRAELNGATLFGAKFRGADLSDAELKGADLTRADLSDAKLIKTELEGAKLDGATIAGAIFDPASMPDLDHVINMKGIAKVQINDGNTLWLFKMRATFRETGQRQAEREATFVIKFKDGLTHIVSDLEGEGYWIT